MGVFVLCVFALIRDLFRDTRGSTVTFIAAAAIPLVAFTGLAIDSARGYLVKSRLAYALDAAALAGARRINEPDFQATVDRFFESNFPTGYMGSTGVSLTTSTDADKTEVTLTANVDIDLTLMQVVGLDNMKVGGTTVVKRENRGLEIAIALDTTGSMNGYIDDLQDAVDLLLDNLYGSKDEIEHLTVALVPFDTRINLNDYHSVLNYTPPVSWEVCPNPRSGTYNTTDDPPVTASFDQDWRWTSFDESYYAWYGCNAEKALALTKSRSTIDARMDELNHSGNTRVDVGAVWAYRMVSAEWQGLWGDPDRPVEYDDPDIKKAVIIMTDGENTPLDGSSQHTANTRLSDTCDNMKLDGILVYTVQFRTTSSSLETLLTDCATSAGHYYKAADSAALAAAFYAIGVQLSNLRIAQ